MIDRDHCMLRFCERNTPWPPTEFMARTSALEDDVLFEVMSSNVYDVLDRGPPTECALPALLLRGVSVPSWTQ